MFQHAIPGDVILTVDFGSDFDGTFLLCTYVEEKQSKSLVNERIQERCCSPRRLPLCVCVREREPGEAKEINKAPGRIDAACPFLFLSLS